MSNVRKQSLTIVFSKTTYSDRDKIEHILRKSDGIIKICARLKYLRFKKGGGQRKKLKEAGKSWNRAFCSREKRIEDIPMRSRLQTELTMVEVDIFDNLL